MKTGLVLEGGASRTLFTCGVLDVLLKENIYADYVVGTSAGICSGTSFVSKQYGRNYNVDVKYMSDKRYMGLRHLLNRKNKSYYNLDFVFDDIPNRIVPFDYETYESFSGEVEAAVTNMETGKPEYMPVSAEDKSFNILRATCALPILFPPIIINGRPYMDGGLSDSIPFEHAAEKDCDKILVILTRPKGYVKKQSKAFKIIAKAYAKYPNFVEAARTRYIHYNECLDKLWAAQEEGKVFVIAPMSEIPYKRTESSPEKLDIMYKMGIKSAQSVMPDLKRYLGL